MDGAVMANNLAEAMVEDLATMGLGTFKAPNGLRSIDGENTLVELEQQGSFITVLENGEVLAELDTENSEFNEILMAHLATSLNF